LNVENIFTQLRKAFDELPHDYTAAKIQSEKIDSLLGLNYEPIERELSHQQKPGPNTEYWLGLPIQSLLTPYSELVHLVRHLQPKDGATWIDLGAAYGRLGIVLGVLAPQVHFLGYEVVEARVRLGQELFSRLGLKKARLLAHDLSETSFKPEEADCYFIYDFGSREAVSKTLSDLREISMRRPITIIARGRRCRHLIDRFHPWLSVTEPEHFSHYSIYKSSN
jgi:hypothetical protein